MAALKWKPFISQIFPAIRGEPTMKNLMNLASTGPERIGEPEGKIRAVSADRVRYRNRVVF